MRFPALLLFVLSALLPLPVAAQATLNKCIDAAGKVTYSNLPCRNAQQVKKVEIDPPPQAARPQGVQTPVPPAASAGPVQPSPVPASAPVAVPVPTSPTMQDPPAARKAPVIAIEPSPKYIEAQPSPVQPSARPSASQCNALSDQLGRVFDKMDAARRVGATQEQMKNWNEEIKELERKKQQSGCF
jgi:hypothetical protein